MKIQAPIITVTVTCEIVSGRPMIVCQDEESPYRRYWLPEEVLERGGEGWAAEGDHYRHVYTCDASVPGAVADVLTGRKAEAA